MGLSQSYDDVVAFWQTPHPATDTFAPAKLHVCNVLELQAKAPVRAEFPPSWSSLSVLGMVGTVPVRLLEPSKSCVKFLKDVMDVGIVPVNDVDVRSSVCREATSIEESTIVDSGDGDKACELTSRLCNPVSFVMLLGKLIPIFELRNRARVDIFVSPGDENSVSGRAVIAVDSKWRVVMAVRFTKESGREPAGTVFPPTTVKVWRSDRAPISLGSVAGTPGYVSANEETRPELSHATPVQVQKLTVCDQLPLPRVA